MGSLVQSYDATFSATSAQLLLQLLAHFRNLTRISALLYWSERTNHTYTLFTLALVIKINATF